jgi:uncharacterized protein YukE
MRSADNFTADDFAVDDFALDDFAVDADGLHRVIGELSNCESDLRGLAADLAKQIKTLHSTWQGQAAMAQAIAQACLPPPSTT